MSEQFLKGYAVDAKALHAVVGREDFADLMRAAKRKRILFEEVTELLDEWDSDLAIDEVLINLSVDALNKKHAYAYRRVLQIVAEIEGKALKPDDITLPGRGWQDLGPAWKHWGLTQLAKAYAAPFAWPAKIKASAVDWPIALLIAQKDLEALAKELRAFKVSIIEEKGVPKGVPRFADWEREELSEELTPFFKDVAKWCDGAKKAKRDLLIWIDGQQ